MPPEPPDTGALVDAAARVVGLTIAAEYRAGVVLNYERALMIVAPLLALDLDDELTPAPVFRAEQP